MFDPSCTVLACSRSCRTRKKFKIDIEGTGGKKGRAKFIFVFENIYHENSYSRFVNDNYKKIYLNPTNVV